MKKLKTLILGLCIVPLVSGCALFRDSGKTHYALRSTGSLEQASGASELARGRELLDQGQNGLAIVALRNARLFPEQAAAANNGLGIAYARLDRFDLAERYFREAIAAAPDEERYQANLSRLHRSAQALTARTVRSTSAPALANAGTSTVRTITHANGATVVRVQFPTARAVRVSANEIHIATPLLQPAKAADGRRINPATQVATISASGPARRINPAGRLTINGGK